MIRSFVGAETERFYTTGKSRRLPHEILRRAAMRLRQLDAATRVDDLRLPPSNRLEALKGRSGWPAFKFVSMISGASVFGLLREMLLMWKSQITIEE